MVSLPMPEFVDAPARCFVGLSDRFTPETRDRIPALYQRFFQAQLCPEHGLCGALFGLSYNSAPEGFDYAVAVEVSGNGAVPDGACRVGTPAGRYAVFRARGPVMEIPQMFDAVLQDWLPGAGVELAEGPVFECYPDDPDCEASEENGMVMRYEIWVPVKD
ncbi:GyrI-like domain-containing protein [Aliiroseovarius sp.]|uniref:GyrI-like domain-containing protein n=1 Tax=Aliiroseovarius sp. TaxID=1872442 RepID=UPI00263710DD|nr:GyrI-like domain-containing protein [Aliiroseovarius sp.]